MGKRIVRVDNVKGMMPYNRMVKKVKPLVFEFETVEGNKEILNFKLLFQTGEISRRFLKTESSPPCTHYCYVNKAAELGPLIQYFSWCNNDKIRLDLESEDYSNVVTQLKLVKVFGDKVPLLVSNNPSNNSISFMLEFENLTIGLIIDYIGESPNKIFGISETHDVELTELTYVTPKEGQEAFKLAQHLIERYKFE